MVVVVVAYRTANDDDEPAIQYIEENQEYEFIEEDQYPGGMADDDEYALGYDKQQQHHGSAQMIDYINDQHMESYYTIEIEDDDYGKDTIIA